MNSFKMKLVDLPLITKYSIVQKTKSQPNSKPCNFLKQVERIVTQVYFIRLIKVLRVIMISI